MHSNGAVYARHLNPLKRPEAPLTKTVTLTVLVNMLLTGHNIRFLELYDADKFHFLFLENTENVYSIINKLTSTIRPMKLPEQIEHSSTYLMRTAPLQTVRALVATTRFQYQWALGLDTHPVDIPTLFPFGIPRPPLRYPPSPRTE